MRKFTLFLMSLFLTLGTAMAQNSLDLTFTKVSADEATVNVEGIGVDATGITAEITANSAWKELEADNATFPNASILCPDKNTNAMTAGNEGVITITLKNVPEGFSFKNVTFTSAALNGGGEFQGDDVNAQLVNFTLTQGETVLGTAENVKIKVNSNAGESVTVPFEVAEAYTATDGTLELALTLSIDEPRGCFYGLVKVSIEAEYAAVEPEPEPEPEPEVVYVSNLADFNPNKYYTVSTTTRGGWSVDEGLSQFCSTNDAGFGLATDAAEVRNQFAVLTVDNENYYLYSVAAQKFVKADRTLVAGVADAIEFADASSEGENRVRVNFKNVANAYINLGGSNQMIVDGWDTVDAGNAVVFVESGDFDSADALAMLAPAEPEVEYATEEALAALLAATEKADALLATAGYQAATQVVTPIDIASNADAMLYSNAPCTNTSWGDEFKGWDVLFDDNAATIFHSEYGSKTSVDGLDHYLRVDLGEGNELSQFTFTFTTREKNCNVNSPTTIVVEGSNEADGEYTEIKTITGIPQENSYKYESEVLGSVDGPAYRFIRYRVTQTATNQADGGGKVFFFIAEFGMSKVSVEAIPSVNEEYAASLELYVALAAANEAAKAVLAEEQPLAETVAAAAATLDAAIVAIEGTTEPVALEVVSVSPEAGEVKALTEVVVTFNTEVTLDETKSIKLVAEVEEEESDVTPIEAYAGDWAVYSSYPGYDDYTEVGTIEVIDYQGTPALLCSGFSGYEETFAYNDSFLLIYNAEDGSVYFPSQNTANFDYNGASYESMVVCSSTVENVVFMGELTGKLVDGNIVFESVAENKYVADSWMFYAKGLGSLSYFNALTLTPATAAAAPAKAREMFKLDVVETAIKPIAGAMMKANVVEYNVTAQVNAEDATQLVITIDGELADGTYKLVIEEGAVVTADGQANEAIEVVYDLKKPEPLKATATPSEPVEILDAITIEFNKDIVVDWGVDNSGTGTGNGVQYIKVKDANGGVAGTIWTSTAVVESNSIKLTLERAITEVGVYTIAFPAGVVTSVDGEAYAGETFSFTVAEPAPETFAVEAALFPAVDGNITEIKGIRVEANQGASLSALPTEWTLTNEAGEEYEMQIQWLYDYETILITVNPAITEYGTYTLTIPEGSLTTDDGKICEAATFSWSIVDPYAPRHTGNKSRNDRTITSVEVVSSVFGASVYDLTQEEMTQDYTDATANAVLMAAPGEELTVNVTSTGSWVHFAVYVDEDGDGFTSGIEEGSDYAPAGDLVAYSFYNNGSSSDESGWNSVGDVVTGNDRDKPAIPAFTAPAEAGTYRMRIQQDWCSIDPMGDADGKFGDFKSNGGQIVDVILEVVVIDGVENVVTNENTVIYDLTGRKIEKISGKGIYIVNGKKMLVK